MWGMIAAVSLIASAGAERPGRVSGGWTLGKPAVPTDNGSATVVQLGKTAAGVTVTYVAFAASEGGTTAVDFVATKRCRDQWFGARVSFDDPSVAHEAAVRGEIHEAFVKFRAKCGAPPIAETTLMTGFGPAFAAADKQAAAAR